MSKIKQLPQQEAQKIAAGEVIERPVNIIKELIENSIDAGATHVTIHVEEAGKSLIRIIDNGCGMDSDDAQICFNRHATSKITHVQELETINTFGFRGEALASIASVSHVVLVTKEEQTTEGTQVLMSAGTITEVNAIACSSGTDITIKDLFFNVPARKKFLKSTETEWRAIQHLFNAFCFDYPHIRFALFSNNKQTAQYPQTDSLHKRALQMWDTAIHPHVITLEKTEHKACSIEGVISDHQHYRYDKSGIHFFVNKRWVKNYQLNNALIKGYTNVIPDGRYPIAALHITVPSHEVDINIHPRKEEVKFLHPRAIEQAIQQVIKTTLEQNISRHIKKDVTFQQAPQPTFSLSRAQESTFTPFNFDAFFAHQTHQSTYAHTPTPSSPVVEQPLSLYSSGQNDEPFADSFEQQAPLKTTESVNLIGQYNKTYLLIEKEEGLFLIDQHAAHERILYEQFAHKFDSVATVQLLFPHIITLTHNDMNTVLPHLNIFIEHGIVIDQHADNQLIVQSLPVHLKNESIESLVKEAIGWIIEHASLNTAEFKKTIDHKLQAQMACKAAVKAGDELSHEKMIQLITDLEKVANRFSCPHGRPTGWLLSLHDIEKKFRRKL